MKKSPWIGIRLGVTGTPSLKITSVTVGSPAEAAGLAVGDQIVAIDAVAVATVDGVAAILDKHVPGDTIVVAVTTVATDGSTRRRDVSVVLGDHTL